MGREGIGDAAQQATRFRRRMSTALPPLIAVLGPTASGKSGLAVALAKQLNGEVISADSRQVYRGLDIGSGKITRDEMEGVPHHLLDICEPGGFFSLGEYLPMANRCAGDILSRGKTPILCGGTGLYVSAVCDGYALSDVKPDLEYRKHLETLTTPELARLLRAQCPESDVEPNNRHRVMRALEKLRDGDSGHAPSARRYRVLRLGTAWPRETLWARIAQRLDARLQSGMAEETRGLLARGVPADFLLRLGLEYRFLTEYIQSGADDITPTRDRLYIAIRQFAKRQSTWFRRDEDTVWLDMTQTPERRARETCERFLTAREGDAPTEYPKGP